MATIIDSLYEENESLLRHLESAKEISLSAHANGLFRKTLLLSIASYFESVVVDGIVTIVGEFTSGVEAILEFVKNKAIERQYHTYFQWERRNANSFFGLFGAEFKEFMSGMIKADADFDASIKAFLELGELRNQLVHQNFATFPLEKTAQEIYALYQKALPFVEDFPRRLREYCKARGTQIDNLLA
jgi:hypothetical protein